MSNHTTLLRGAAPARTEHSRLVLTGPQALKDNRQLTRLTGDNDQTGPRRPFRR